VPFVEVGFALYSCGFQRVSKVDLLFYSCGWEAARMTPKQALTKANKLWGKGKERGLVLALRNGWRGEHGDEACFFHNRRGQLLFVECDRRRALPKTRG